MTCAFFLFVQISKRLSEAYRILSDPTLRRQHDYSLWLNACPKNTNLVLSLPVSLKSLFSGDTLVVTVERQALCVDCSRNWSLTCQRCVGKGYVGEVVDVEVEIPKGARAGTEIHFENEGHQFRAHQAPGYLMIVIEEEPDKMFKRAGDDLHMDLVIDRKDYGGFRLLVPMLDGQKLEVDVEPDDLCSDELVVAHEGFTIYRSKRRGDLHVHLLKPKSPSKERLSRSITTVDQLTWDLSSLSLPDTRPALYGTPPTSPPTSGRTCPIQSQPQYQQPCASNMATSSHVPNSTSHWLNNQRQSTHGPQCHSLGTRPIGEYVRYDDGYGTRYRWTCCNSQAVHPPDHY